MAEKCFLRLSAGKSRSESDSESEDIVPLCLNFRVPLYGIYWKASCTSHVKQMFAANLFFFPPNDVNPVLYGMWLVSRLLHIALKNNLKKKLG